MKIESYSICALFALSTALAGERTTDAWGPATNNAQMAISVTSPWSQTFQVGDTNVAAARFSVKHEVKVGQPFSLLVRIRNLSTNETLSFYNALQPNTSPDVGLACVVISPSGKDVSPTRTAAGGSGQFAVARPNQTTQFEFGLSGLCKLEETGTYKITAKKNTFGNADKAFVLTSNTLSVSVVPDK